MNKLNVFVSKKGWNDEEKAIALDKRGFVVPILIFNQEMVICLLIL